jgi:hypothetical protein
MTACVQGLVCIRHTVAHITTITHHHALMRYEPTHERLTAVRWWGARSHLTSHHLVQRLTALRLSRAHTHRQYFDVRATMLTKQEARPALAVTVDYPTLLRAPEFASSSGGEPAIVQDIRDEPDRVLRVMALAIHQIMLEVLTTEVIVALHCSVCVCVCVCVCVRVVCALQCDGVR